MPAEPLWTRLGEHQFDTWPGAAPIEHQHPSFARHLTSRRHAPDADSQSDSHRTGPRCHRPAYHDATGFLVKLRMTPGVTTWTHRTGLRIWCP